VTFLFEAIQKHIHFHYAFQQRAIFKRLQESFELWAGTQEEVCVFLALVWEVVFEIRALAPPCLEPQGRKQHLPKMCRALSTERSPRYATFEIAHFASAETNYHVDRHMIRHKEKDDEAGGEGLGHLATRKRLWRDANGNIVNARRPNPRADGAKKRQCTSSISSAEGTKERKNSTSSEDSGPPSPPTSAPSLTGAPSLDQFDNSVFPQDSWQPVEGSHANDVADPFDFLCNASWGAPPYHQPFVGGTADGLPYDDIFKPDTGMYIKYENDTWNETGFEHQLEFDMVYSTIIR
jgi:hypothetical protein